MAATRRVDRIELSAGGVIFRRRLEAALEVLLIMDGYGNWGFPKGHVEPGEDPMEAALRECREETGLSRLRAVGSVGTTDWYFRMRKALVHKYCDYFVVEADLEDSASPQRTEGIRECRWLSAAEADSLITYANARQILRVAMALPALRLGAEPAKGRASSTDPAAER